MFSEEETDMVVDPVEEGAALGSVGGFDGAPVGEVAIAAAFLSS